jgi:hypothetical protein
MNLTKMIDELRTERQNIDQAILMFERLVAGQGKKRGRPPAWMSNARQVMPDAARKAQSERMKAYWAAKRKKTAASAKKK